MKYFSRKPPWTNGLTRLRGASLLSLLLFFDLTFITVVARALNVQSQSTLIVCKGETELDRSVGDTSDLSIEGLLDKTL